MDGSSGFDVIETPQIAVAAGGRTFTVRPLTIGQLPGFARALRPVLPAVQRLFEGDGAIDPAAVTDLIADHGEQIIAAVAIALGVPQQDVERLDAAALLELVPAVIRLNADFFARRLHPTLAGAVQAMSGAGQTSSSP